MVAAGTFQRLQFWKTVCVIGQRSQGPAVAGTAPLLFFLHLCDALRSSVGLAHLTPGAPAH